jgi:putative oxidoreductase
MANDLGKLVLRLTLGIFMLLHGISKISGGVGGIEKMLQGSGMPGFFAYGLYLGEVVAPIPVILGLYARIGGAVMVVNMLFAIMLVHRAEVFMLGKTGGWALELQGFFLFTALALVLMGPGRYSVNQR